MSGKLKIIALAALALVVFGVSFMLSVLMRPESAGGPEALQPTGKETDAAGLDLALAAAALPVQPVTLAMKERELAELIKEVRMRIEACKKRQEQLDKLESRIHMAGEELRKQAQELEALRMQLVTPLTRLREAKAELENTRVRVATEEKANLKRIAAMYEKMDSASGGQILVSMCEKEQEDDAVKILHYMSERAAGKVLSEMTDKNLAAKLCAKLKRVREES